MIKDSRGFLLLDTLLAVTLLAIILVPVINISFYSTRVTNKIIHETTAIVLAQDRIEEIKGIPIEEIIGGSDRFPLESISSGGIEFTRKTIIEPEGELLKIRVEILWEEGETKLVTYKGRF